MNEGLTSLLTLARFGLTTGESRLVCPSGMDLPDRFCCLVSLGISVNDCVVVDYSDLCFPSFPHIGMVHVFR